MVALSLKICVRHCNVVKTMQFEPSTAVYDACRVIRERVPEAQTGQGEFLYLSLVSSLAELKVNRDPFGVFCTVLFLHLSFRLGNLFYFVVRFFSCVCVCVVLCVWGGCVWVFSKCKAWSERHKVQIDL